MEESWPLLVAVSMVGGDGSTEDDSMMFRLGSGLHSFGPLALLIATSRESMSLTTPSSLSMVQKIGQVTPTEPKE